MKDENGNKKITRERIAQVLSKLLSDQYGAEITIILKNRDEDKKDEPTEVKK